MSTLILPRFDETAIGLQLATMSRTDCDELEFGVIGFDAETRVRLYNATESRLAGLSSHRVLGLPLFEQVAPCMNNFLVAHRFVNAAAEGVVLDAVVDYVLTLRMKPVKVKLRLIALPGAPHRFVLVERRV